MEEITHFSHEHKLSLFQADFEDPKPYRCHICALPILSTPSYTCNIHPNNCNNFFVHKACTQLPQTFFHNLHLKTLHLTKPACVGDSFTYEFENSRGLDLHPLVAQPLEICSQHRSHNIAHPLALLCREISCRCDVCGEKENGFFFNCKECGFFIHQDCTVLPSVMKIPSHSHPFILAYSLPYVPSNPAYSDDYNNKCSICNGVWLLPNGGVYFCGECYALAHVACAKPADMTNVISDTEFVHLPKEEDTMVIRSFVEKNQKNPASSSSSSCSQIIENHYKHPLILEDACSSRDDNLVCDVCIQPCSINTASSSYYRSGDFVAHPFCAPHLLPPRFKVVHGPVRWELLLRGHDQLAQSFFNSVFCCYECKRLSNGFSYTAADGFMHDIECAVAPKTMKHASHKQHILFQTGTRWFSDANCKISCCTDEFSYGSMYRCVVCEYSIHTRCALLPKTTPHYKFDEHPLHLIMNTPPPPDKDYFCEVCEQQMDHHLKEWYYACHECDQYFHVNCIPSVGLMSKIKFRKTLDNKLHEHPLTLTRMLTHERNETCGLCNKTIEGFSDDEMALHCTPCHFWLHFFCAAAATNWPPDRCNKKGLQFYG